MKKLLTTAALLVCFTAAQAAVTGLWQTIDDETGQPKSIVSVYENSGLLYGRILMTYNPDGSVKDTISAPKTKADKVEGDPYFCGLDIIWNMKADGAKYKDGKIMDPKKGKVYNSEMWIDDATGNLIVRGKIGPFGRNQTWKPFDPSKLTFKAPNPETFTPKISKGK